MSDEGTSQSLGDRGREPSSSFLVGNSNSPFLAPGLPNDPALRSAGSTGIHYLYLNGLPDDFHLVSLSGDQIVSLYQGSEVLASILNTIPKASGIPPFNPPPEGRATQRTVRADFSKEIVSGGADIANQGSAAHGESIARSGSKARPIAKPSIREDENSIDLEWNEGSKEIRLTSIDESSSATEMAMENSSPDQLPACSTTTKNAAANDIWTFRKWFTGARNYHTPPISRGHGLPKATSHEAKCDALRNEPFQPPPELEEIFTPNLETTNSDDFIFEPMLEE
ncbi:hypothetical protein CVT26_013007 [Gymnopilus dilepis]|uniref:Uncharacterized protein n=1 Tax=Gymnopilus dilepis TaxID=231916 RepID=A0A409WXG2_9AGAR|nr:hypothetical protein CVT26_013007 [Gymnopilus dilepis]